jgi:methylthioribose-1-phosphate isomerase
MNNPALKFENDTVYILDQTLLPHQKKYIRIQDAEAAFEAIQALRIRGAPAIGIMAAYTMYITARKYKDDDFILFRKKLDHTYHYLIECRPTAVNLAWALNEMRSLFMDESSSSVSETIKAMKIRAISIHKTDAEACRQMGFNGLDILPNPCRIITHCNTGSLATGGWGTAMGVIYAAVEKGWDIHVFVDETRPLGQGGRLTFWELQQNRIPCTLITDSTAAFLMKQKRVNSVIFGADRIVANGDVANKIGSYSLAVAANYHQIPVFVAAPTSTFDRSLENGDMIPIEQRDSKEILQIYGYDNNLFVHNDVYNPAFDITPADLITAIVTERGVIKKPFQKTINQLFKQI